MKDSRIVPLSEQEAEAKEVIKDEGEEISLEDAPKPEKAYLVTFTYGYSHSEYTMHEGSMKVALGRGFMKWKASLPKRTRIKELNIAIKTL